MIGACLQPVVQGAGLATLAPPLKTGWILEPNGDQAGLKNSPERVKTGLHTVRGWSNTALLRGWQWKWWKVRKQIHQQRKKRTAVFLTVIGAHNYQTLRSLVSHNKLSELTFQHLVDKLGRYFARKRITIVERYKFHRREQLSHESVGDYLAGLWKLTEHCSFAAFLGDAIRDIFVCGLRSVSIQKKLLTEPDLTLSRVVEMAQSLEAAEQQAPRLHQTPCEGGAVGNVSKVVN